MYSIYVQFVMSSIHDFHEEPSVQVRYDLGKPYPLAISEAQFGDFLSGPHMIRFPLFTLTSPTYVVINTSVSSDQSRLIISVFRLGLTTIKQND